VQSHKMLPEQLESAEQYAAIKVYTCYIPAPKNKRAAELQTGWQRLRAPCTALPLQFMTSPLLLAPRHHFPEHLH
jgi:hypothetical protein